jgi:hypothetical protein
MAKSQMRRNREHKKPKKQKAEIVPLSPVFSTSPTKTKAVQYTKRQK